MAKYSDIHSDEWRAYNKIRKNSFKHYTVNHKENFVNPLTGKHTQLIECLWNKAKIEIDKRIRGRSERLLHGYLAQQWFFSVVGKDESNRFLKMCELLKENTYNIVKLEISEQLKKIDDFKKEYCLKNNKKYEC